MSWSLRRLLVEPSRVRNFYQRKDLWPLHFPGFDETRWMAAFLFEVCGCESCYGREVLTVCPLMCIGYFWRLFDSLNFIFPRVAAGGVQACIAHDGLLLPSNAHYSVLLKFAKVRGLMWYYKERIFTSKSAGKIKIYLTG